jgi:hypothetical protein
MATDKIIPIKSNVVAFNCKNNAKSDKIVSSQLPKIAGVAIDDVFDRNERSYNDLIEKLSSFLLKVSYEVLAFNKELLADDFRYTQLENVDGYYMKSLIADINTALLYTCLAIESLE